MGPKNLLNPKGPNVSVTLLQSPENETVPRL